MAKHKYKFNQESLSFVKVKRSRKQKFLNFLTYFISSIILAIIYWFVYFSLFDSPKEKGLKRQISELKVNYEIIQQDFNRMETVLQDLQDRDDNIYRTIFETEPIHSTIREAGYGGSNAYQNLENLENADIVINVKKQLDMIMKKIYVQSVSYDEVIDLAKNKEAMLAGIPAIQPISNKDLKRTASGWGYRIHPIYKIRKFHYGMDFTAPLGTDIYATGDGTVIEVESSRRGYGNKVIIDHGFGYKTLYAHMNSFNVKQGQIVKRGDVIGSVGNTGLSTAPHLHYEVSLNNKKVNPVNYYFNDLTPEEYERMIELSLKSGQTFD
ncbi:MAG: M23 family metallopeptidase [Bacteroidales bacterium]|nr:M23 family metallopeptidase [Bacteroidales bacterium]MBN2819435.1 M23 family metallopeptidase [Bacteroidales bacterium]